MGDKFITSVQKSDIKHALKKRHVSDTGCVDVCEYERGDKPAVFNIRNIWLTPFPDML
jgi:hypothetical protein